MVAGVFRGGFKLCAPAISSHATRNIRALHTRLRTAEDPTGIKHVKNEVATSTLSRLDLIKQLCVLRAMRMTALHPIAKIMLDANSNTALGKASQVLMKPFIDQFCTEGSADVVVNAAKKKLLDPNYVIFDFAEEMIDHSNKALRTVEQYYAYLQHPDVRMIAVKISGICSPEVLETGEPDHVEIQNAKIKLANLCQMAQQLGKTIFVDAEHYAAEDAGFASSFMEKHQGHVYLTFQATRKDSKERIETIKNNLPEGKKLYFKLVKGAYTADRLNFPTAFYQTFDGTHDNFIALLESSFKDPRIEVLPCTHNPQLIQLADKLGIQWVGNLSGMETTHQSIRYYVGHHDSQKLTDYMKRRFERLRLLLSAGGQGCGETRQVLAERP